MAKAKKNSELVITDRRSEERRGTDRRQRSIPVAVERRSSSDDRRKAPRRRQIDPTTCERDYSEHEIEFMHALDAYKRANGRMFPTCSEILEVLRGLGYVRLPVTPATPEPMPAASTLDDQGANTNAQPLA